MKIIPCKQGTPEWMAARIGIPTASSFDRIITKTGKPSASADRYLAKLVAEWYLGCSLDDYVSQFMERGTEMEASAVRFYEFATGVDTQEVGFIVRDDGRCGASPDRLVGDNGLLEIKCPSPEVHMTYVLGGLSDEYKVQQQGQLWVAEREWCDLLSFHPVLPRATVRVFRDEPFIETLSGLMRDFLERLDDAKARLLPQKAERDERLQGLNEAGETT